MSGHGRFGARPGEFYPYPLTKLERETLQMLAEGFKPLELLRPGEKIQAFYMRMHRMRVKLDALTSFEMGCKAAWDGIVVRPGKP